ncbi:MAG: isocitrate/isopropylmalate family dehydrogenase, partial [Candidatus Marinimicrobia bacterium]|nr:isocitrate/isopropylmalate family dehydrogenase [Candidatus Neomarinimicrobiota bacterium]
DILSDITAMITGSLGMLPSASIGEKHAMYEPVHGTAPEIAGQNKANPIAMICSVAMMIEITLNQPEAAKRLNNAIESVLEKGIRTIDIASSDSTIVTTDGMRDEIIHAFHRADKSILDSRELVRK